MRARGLAGLRRTRKRSSPNSSRPLTNAGLANAPNTNKLTLLRCKQQRLVLDVGIDDE
jgi:hypothetical protein